jgi:hypothetical protein
MRLPARLAGAKILQPLRHRDHALLVAGSVVSLFASPDPRRTSSGGGLFGAVGMGVLLFIPGVRDPARGSMVAAAAERAVG